MHPIRSVILALVFVATTFTSAASEASDYTASRIVMLQPDWLIGQRVEVLSLVDTIKAVQSAVSGYSGNGEDAAAIASCSIFVALRHPARLRTWSVCAGSDAPALDAHIARSVPVSAIGSVKEGSVIIELAAPDAPPAAGPGTLPAQWRRVAEDHGETLEMEQLLNLVWPM
jgi:hypothetical protein